MNQQQRRTVMYGSVCYFTHSYSRAKLLMEINMSILLVLLFVQSCLADGNNNSSFHEPDWNLESSLIWADETELVKKYECGERCW